MRRSVLFVISLSLTLTLPGADWTLAQQPKRGGVVRIAEYLTGYVVPWRSYNELAADNLGKIGITVELKPEEYGKYISTTAVGKYEKAAMGPSTPFTGFRHHDGYGAGMRLAYTWLDK